MTRSDIEMLKWGKIQLHKWVIFPQAFKERFYIHDSRTSADNISKVWLTASFLSPLDFPPRQEIALGRHGDVIRQRIHKRKHTVKNCCVELSFAYSEESCDRACVELCGESIILMNRKEIYLDKWCNVYPNRHFG